ncbi:chemotaxis protein CheW [Oculatella sp. LEGE 06141]|uniref:chemotaxis protein CheW n=1 Tax=Oculatella sp. LEGE 06141 TaxID=1828648 RepID=UPI001882F922|nr:chemotaxis protein CheW [Oculatella sp. LEGE 06141]MBE9183115.1 chemotaxis protein CheW [Oculatella sp. LEGE 06141]
MYVADQKTTEPIRVIAFAIADYLVALPMDAVLKVVNCPPHLYKGCSTVELVHLGHHTITVVNLHRHLATDKSDSLVSSKLFLVVIRPLQIDGELFALLVNNPPDLIEIPPSVIRPLPESRRQGHPLSAASHVAVLPRKETMLTILLLDIEQVSKIITDSPVPGS